MYAAMSKWDVRHRRIPPRLRRSKLSIIGRPRKVLSSPPHAPRAAPFHIYVYGPLGFRSSSTAPHLTDPTGPPTLRAAEVLLPGILVETSWLEQRLGEPELRIVDLREPGDYSESHVPGAVQLDLARLGTERDGCDNVLLTAGDFSDLMESLGIGTGSAVVAYDDQWGLAAARLVWALHFYGHPAATILDGGWDRWREEGRVMTDVATTPAHARFEVSTKDDVGADLEWLSTRVPGAELTLLDTRTQGEFDQGHLPGAIPWDWFNAVPPDSWDCAREPEELRVEWGKLGIDPSHEIVVYCRSGMRAAHTYVVLKHAGYPRVRLYDGSWQEWSLSL